MQPWDLETTSLSWSTKMPNVVTLPTNEYICACMHMYTHTCRSNSHSTFVLVICTGLVKKEMKFLNVKKENKEKELEGEIFLPYTSDLLDLGYPRWWTSGLRWLAQRSACKGTPTLKLEGIPAEFRV